MTNRINDQNRLDQQLLEERQEYTQKQTTQRDFANKLFTQQTSEHQQKELGSQIKTKTATDSKQSEKVGKEKAQEKLTATQLPTRPKTAQGTTVKEKAVPQSQTKKADDKKETKKSSDKRVKSEKAKNETVLQQVAKQKKESDVDDREEQESDAFFQQAVSMGTGPFLSTQAPTGSTPPVLSQEVINQLVDHIYSSTNTQGLKELTIELKNGVLAGAQIQVSASKGKVNLHFKSDDPRTKTLLRNSKSEIAKRLGEKNLSLSEFVVD